MTTDPLVNPLLAALPETGGYISLFKWIVMLAGVTGWLAVCQWVDKDSWRLHYRRFIFNGVVVGSGALGVLLWLLAPLYVVGMLIFLVLAGGSAGAYVYLRNQIVKPASRVLTAEHFDRLLRRRLPESRRPPPQVTLWTAEHQQAQPLGEDDPLHPGYLAGQTILADALARRAERVSLVPADRGVQVQVSVDGVVGAGEPLARREADLVIAYFKKLAGLDTSDRRRPQAGRIRAEQPGRSLDVEVHTSGTRAGETMRLQVLDSTFKPALETLGLTDRQLELLAEFRRGERGVVIVGAADGVGSTTTFYRMLSAHDAFMTNIQTLEQKVDGELENIRQHAHSAGESEEVSFARALQSIIRRGPDVVGVSLCRDKQTAKLIAATAAETTKFYVQMAGKDTFTLLARWAGLVGDLPLAMGPVRLLFAQMLVRKLCPNCKEAYRPDPQLLRKVNLPADRIDRLYRPPAQYPVDKQGNPIVCEHCQGAGYHGRTGVFEMLAIDDEVRRLVTTNASANEIKKYCRSQKMFYLQEEALRKVIAGETSIHEVMRVLKER